MPNKETNCILIESHSIICFACEPWMSLPFIIFLDSTYIGGPHKTIVIEHDVLNYRVFHYNCFKVWTYYCEITITDGHKNTLKSLMSPLHFKTIQPKLAIQFLKFFARTIPPNLKIFLILKNTQVLN
jgi:hypothetical protein